MISAGALFPQFILLDPITVSCFILPYRGNKYIILFTQQVHDNIVTCHVMLSMRGMYHDCIYRVEVVANSF